MILCMVVSVGSPAVSFVTISVALGYFLSRLWKRTMVASFISSAFVGLAFVLLRTALPTDFRYYAQDMIHEPLIRDFLRPASETIASAAFHFGVPWAVLSLLLHLLSLRANKKV